MAEMPEVEVLAADMRALVVGRTIGAVTVVAREAIRTPEPNVFVALLRERRFLAVQRRAKYILCGLSDELTLALHCALSGTVQLTPTDAPALPGLLVRFGLTDGEDLQFRDRDAFARAAAGPDAELRAKLKLDTLGPEILDPTFTPAALGALLAKRRGALKPLLVNQHALAGLGLRDADESLWLAQILPLRVALALTEEEVARLHAAFRSVLAEGLELRGTMTDLRGVRGTARHRRNVFGRAGEPCPRCGTPISRTPFGQQVAFYCTGCQS